MLEFTTTSCASGRRDGNPSRRTLEKLLAAVESSLAEFEALRAGGDRAGWDAAAPALGDPGRAWGAAQLPPLPLLATAVIGEWGEAGSAIELAELRPGEFVDRIARPPSLANDPRAYAITIVGDSMWPRFRPGRRVAVSPKAPVAIGDDVLVKLGNRVRHAAGESVLIKELVRRTGRGVELRQFNPDVTFAVSAADIASIEKIAGELF